MADQTIIVDPAMPHIGAQVSGAGITSPLSSLNVDMLHRAPADHQVVFLLKRLSRG